MVSLLANPKRRTSRIIKRREKMTMLSDALFGPRWLGYAVRRLLFPGSRMGLMAFFHALEAAALLLIFEPRYLIPIISVRLASSLASSAIWGATESLRQDVRALFAQGDRSKIGRRVEEALARASLLALLVFLTSVFWVWCYPYVGPGYFSVIDAYVVALGFRVALSWISRTYHSGLLATRRVYRPRWSLVVPDIIDGLGLFLFWRIIGPWSIAVAVISSTLLHAILSYAYARRGYRDAHISLPRWFRRKRLAIPNRSLAWRWTLSVCIGLSCELPSVFVLGQWHSISAGADVTFVMLLYWVRPFASFLSSIPRIYYVDLVRAELLGPLGSERLRRSITRIILVLGVFLVIATAGLAFRFADLGAVLRIALYMLLSTALAAFTLRAVLYMIHGYAPSPQKESLPLLSFLHAATAMTEPCQASLFQLDAKQPTRIARALVETLQSLDGVQACRLGRRYLLCISTKEHSMTDWICASQGTAQFLMMSPWSSNGAQALSTLHASKRFPSTLRTLLAAPASLDELETLLENASPSTVLTARNRSRCEKRPGSLAELRHTIRQYLGPAPPALSHWGEEGRVLLVMHNGSPLWLGLLSDDLPVAQAAELRRMAWALGVRDAWLGDLGKDV